MKDPNNIFRRKRTKLMLLVSFNGEFRRREPSGKLRYTGGETRLLSVDRGITFSRLKSQVLDLIVQSCNVGCTLFSLKYQLQDSSETERSDEFVSIVSDDDVLCMVDEFERREIQGKYTRLWVFVCSSSNDGFVDYSNMKGYLSKSEKGKRLSDDCLRKMVLKQQLLAKQQYNKSGNGDMYKVNVLDYEYKNGDFGGYENFRKVLPLLKSRPLNSKDNNLRLGVNCSMKGSLCRDSFVSLGAELQSLELSRSSNRSSFRIDGFDAKLEPVSVELTQSSGMNRENIVPWSMDLNTGRNGVDVLSRNNQSIASICTTVQGDQDVLGGTRCSLRNHIVGLSELRKGRNSPYQIRNRGNVYEVGKHGKSSTGKIFPDQRCSSSILKRGQTMRPYNFASLKGSSGHRNPTVKDMTEINNLHSSDDSCALEELVDQCRQGLPQHGKGNSTECHLDYGSGTIIKSDVSPLPIDSATRAVKSQKDLLSCPGTGKLEVQCQALSRDVLDRSTICQPLSDIDKDLKLLSQKKVIKLISFEDNLEWSCGSMTSSSYQNSISSAVDLSLHDLCLSGSSKMELEGSPHERSDISQSFLKPQSQDFDAMDEEHLSSGLQVEKSSEAVSCSLLGDDLRKKNYTNSEEDMQHGTHTNPSICKQVENGKTNKCSNVNGVIPVDILVSHPCAVKTGLQTIKNTDLEYIKELGSGTYGTVFYGKWKGSDVAIKKLKPSCFTDGTVEEDRLVTDFWKETHILGQLHHPNIVALYGVVADGPVNNLATVTEYMVNGSLKQVLRRKDRTIDRRKRLIIAMDAAFGMVYLHEKNIVHFDLKSHNFLVNMRDPQRPVCKIGDLGLSKIKQRTLVSGGVRGTIPWMAPELLNGENMVTEKVDVYSFGIVMWELLTGEEPYSKMRAEEVIGGIIRGSLRPEIPSWCDPGWRSLMERCWSSDPKARPAFSDIAKELRAMAAAMNIK